MSNRTEVDHVRPRERQGRAKRVSLQRSWSRNWDLYLLIFPSVLFFIIFQYVPMYGAQIAFRNYSPIRGIYESPWVGMSHFVTFVSSHRFWLIFRNTITLSLYHLAAGFPIPIILAISLHYCTRVRFKKTVQLITYAPHFISVVVLSGMIVQFLSPRYGEITRIIVMLGGQRRNFMGIAEFFPSIYVWSEVWQRSGWRSIIYLAALSSVDPSLHEAAVVEGASIPQRVRHIDIPSILPTAVILLILNVGQLMQVGFEKVLLLQTPLNLTTSEIIQTYVYKVGLLSAIPNYSYGAAIGLFSSIISFVLLVSVNAIAKRLGETSLW